MSILKEKYNKEILPAIAKEFSVKNVMQLPRLTKVCVMMGMGQYHAEVKKIENCAEELTAIVGQRAVKTLARKSEAAFKIRQGMTVGTRVTLRNKNMWEFIYRFVNIAAPRIRDFQGFSRKGFDQKGSYSFGISEQGIFPEVNLDKMETVQGMNITFVFENSTPAMSERVLEQFAFPFKKK